MITSKYNYSLVEAKNHLCFAAVFETILEHHLSKRFEQYEIANYFGIHYPADFTPSKLIQNYSITANENDIGMIVSNESINEFFEKNKIPLDVKFSSIHSFVDWEFDDFIVKNLLEGNHLVCGFSYSTLFKESEQNKSVGHVAIITEFFSKKNESYITILDPGPRDFGIKKIKSIELFIASKEKDGGIWVLRPRT